MMWNSGPNPPQEGQQLQIRLIAEASNGYEVDYDDVSLVATSGTGPGFPGWYIDDVEVRLGDPYVEGWYVVTEERGRGVKRLVTVRRASAVEADWLLEHHMDRIDDSTELEWDAAAQRVSRVSRLQFGTLVLEESQESVGGCVWIIEILSAC